MGKAKRKPQPAVPEHRYWDTDNCWFCSTRNACGSCKINKKYVAKQKEERERTFKQKLRQTKDYDIF
jgi:hypothetical protein